MIIFSFLIKRFIFLFGFKSDSHMSDNVCLLKVLFRQLIRLFDKSIYHRAGGSQAANF